MKHPLCLLAVVGSLIVCGAVRAADNDASPAPLLPAAADLRQSIQQLDAQIAAESAEIQHLQSAHDAQLHQQRARRDTLAGQLLDARLAYERAADRIAQLTPRAQSLADQAKQTDHAARAVIDAAHDAAERAAIVLSGVPDADQQLDRLRTATIALTQPLNDQSIAALRTVTAELAAAHADATRLSMRPAEIYTAGGRREPVRLIRIGLAQFAYITDAGQRVGIALASPTQTTGFRWSESINPHIADQIRQAAAAIDARATAAVNLPIDPTGRLAPDALKAAPTLLDQFVAGGPVMYPIALVALLAIILILERWWVLYPGNRRSDALAHQVALTCRDGQFDKATSLAERAGGVVGRVLIACLNRRDRGQRAMEDSIQEQLLQEAPRLNRFMGSIAICAAVAPLLGLLGTVTGIIQTFGVIRTMGSADPSLTAGGISEALITTAAGLIIAVPILVIHSLLRGRSERVLADAERHAAVVLMVLCYDQSADAPAPQLENTPVD